MYYETLLARSRHRNKWKPKKPRKPHKTTKEERMAFARKEARIKKQAEAINKEINKLFDEIEKKTHSTGPA